jgi:ubiquinone/menaquinone biosynthesis C-methylase UbiE
MTKNHKSTDKNSIQRKFYDTIDPDYLKYEKNIPYANYLVSRMMKYLNDCNRRVLEVGAGSGRFTFELAKHIGHIEAIDISKKEIDALIRQSRKYGIKNITTGIVDLFKMDNLYTQSSFDAVVGFFVLHHIERLQYDEIVLNFAKSLRKKGRVVFIEPNNLYPFHLVEMMIEPEMKWEIEKGIYTNYLGCFKRSCKNAGLKLVKFQKFGFIPPPFINIWPKVIGIDSVMEKIPLFNEIFCPFVLMVFEKD